MATPLNPSSIPQRAATIHPYPGYWYQTYTNYGERLYRMSRYAASLLHRANASSSPLAALSLVPKS